jgi:uncharacterized protein YdeI (YjbR/CyaY-like superfamily)
MKDYDHADDWYADRAEWADEVRALRPIVLGLGLTETIKWKHPCYMDDGRNIAIISWRKDCALVSLLKGALVDDPRGRLVQPGQDRSGRYMPFRDLTEIERDRGYLETLLRRAIEVERAGLKVEPLPDEIDYCAELAERLAADEAFRVAFEALTPGRRRHYNMHFAKAKQASTRRRRIEQATERIFAGKGLMDCVCGHSKRMPRCDGSHRRHAT